MKRQISINTMPDGTCRTLKTSHAGLAKFRRQDSFGYTGILVINEKANPNQLNQ